MDRDQKKMPQFGFKLQEIDLPHSNFCQLPNSAFSPLEKTNVTCIPTILATELTLLARYETQFPAEVRSPSNALYAALAA